MNWLTNLVRPRIRALVPKKDVPDNLWDKCPGCGAMLFQKELVENQMVCRHCGHHLRLPVMERLRLLFDDGRFTLLELPKPLVDPLRFRDQKKYADRLKDAQQKTGRPDALVAAEGLLHGQQLVVAAFDFAFMGGSMGMAVGDGIVAAANRAVALQVPFIIFPASGGARMQEGALSLMQLPRSIIAIERVKAAGLPYIVVLTDPTTGGVSASFAMLGDIHLAEPGAQIGFAGARVIENTIREQLPQGFQRAEYLLDHGMVDMVVPRQEQRAVLARLIGLLYRAPDSGQKRTEYGMPRLPERSGRR